MVELLMYFGVFVIVGGILSLLDEKYGVEKYNAWWKFTHKEPLPEGNLLGFICGRNTGERVFPAGVITVIICFFLRYLGEHDLISLLIKGSFLMMPGLLIGFALAGLIRKNPKFSPKVEAVFKAIDRVEDGKVDIKDVVRDVATEAREFGEKVVDSVTRGSDSHATPIQKSPPPQDETKEVVKPSQPKGKSFGEALQAFKSRE